VRINHKQRQAAVVYVEEAKEKHILNFSLIKNVAGGTPVFFQQLRGVIQPRKNWVKLGPINIW